ncbi:MAG: hypothetical protein AB7T74_09945, partial [Clostridia bacterium]
MTTTVPAASVHKGAASGQEATPYAWLTLAAGMVAFFLPAYELKPNRIASGTDAWLWQMPVPAVMVALVLVLMVVWVAGRLLTIRSMAGYQVADHQAPGQNAAGRLGPGGTMIQSALPLVLMLLQVLVLLSPGLF